jgi:hypothetical protein
VIALWLLLAQPAEAARGLLGLEWRPFSRQDLVFVDEGRTSGTAVAEQDGTVRPNLSAFGGAWLNKNVGLVGSLGVAAVVSRSAAGDATATRSWAVLRPELDVRVGWMEPRVRFPIPWVVAGVFGDIPTVRDRSASYTDEEQAAADETAKTDAWRLGGVGGRVGVGVDFRVVEGLSLGAQATVGLVGSTYAGGDGSFTTLWVATDASLLLTWEWPDRRKGARATTSGCPGCAPVPPPQEAASPEVGVPSP